MARNLISACRPYTYPPRTASCITNRGGVCQHIETPGMTNKLQVIPTRTKQWAEEEFISCIHRPIIVKIDPPAATQVADLARPVKRFKATTHSRYQLLEPTLHRQGIGDDDRIVIQVLRGHKTMGPVPRPFVRSFADALLLMTTAVPSKVTIAMAFSVFIIHSPVLLQGSSVLQANVTQYSHEYHETVTIIRSYPGQTELTANTKRPRNARSPGRNIIYGFRLLSCVSLMMHQHSQQFLH